MLISKLKISLRYILFRLVVTIQRDTNVKNN